MASIEQFHKTRLDQLAAERLRNLAADLKQLSLDRVDFAARINDISTNLKAIADELRKR